MRDVTERTDCRVCHAPLETTVLTLTPTPPGDTYVTFDGRQSPAPVYPLELAQCGDCGLVQLRHTVAPEILYGEALYETGISLGLSAHFQRYAEHVITRISLPRGSFVMDIGSNDGTLLKAFQDEGMDVLGVDPSVVPAAKANANGQTTIHGFLTPAVAAQVGRKAHLITVNNLLANVDDVDEFLNCITALLDADGVLVCETGYWPDLVDGLIIDNIYHEHLSYFTVRSLARLFQRHGFSLNAVEHVPTKGGSIRCYVQPLHGTPRALLHTGLEMPALRTRELSPSVFFAENVAHNQRVVQEYVAHAGRLVGYGASVGVTTLLYHYGLGDRLEYLVDDDPIRYGRYSPGQHLPVFASSALYVPDDPPSVLVLAWRYEQAIRARHPSFGGTFVSPMRVSDLIGAA